MTTRHLEIAVGFLKRRTQLGGVKMKIALCFFKHRTHTFSDARTSMQKNPRCARLLFSSKIQQVGNKRRREFLSVAHNISD